MDRCLSRRTRPHYRTSRSVTRARLAIANIDGRNSNVFYELGIAHAMGKTTLLVTKTPEDVPFDIRAKRLVLFSSTDELRARLRDEIAKSVVLGGAQRL